MKHAETFAEENRIGGRRSRKALQAVEAMNLKLCFSISNNRSRIRCSDRRRHLTGETEHCVNVVKVRDDSC